MAGALAVGEGAVGFQLDAFGNVICTAQGARTLPDGGMPAGHVPACCMAGCGVATPVLLPPDMASMLAAIDFELAPTIDFQPAVIGFGRARPVANPRAPPSLA